MIGSPRGSSEVTAGQGGVEAVAAWCGAGRPGVVVRLGHSVVVPGAENAAATSRSIQAARTRSTQLCFNVDNVTKAFPARCSELGVIVPGNAWRGVVVPDGHASASIRAAAQRCRCPRRRQRRGARRGELDSSALIFSSSF
jgi:hypothetical protein